MVPIIGAGTADDPRRPLYSPVAGSQGSKQGSDILAFASQISDDGKFALIELIGRNRAALSVQLILCNPEDYCESVNVAHMRVEEESMRRKCGESRIARIHLNGTTYVAVSIESCTTTSGI